MKIVLKHLVLAVPLTFAAGCVHHHHDRQAVHYPPPPPPARQPQVVVVRQPAPAPEPQVVIVRPPPPAPEPRVVVVKPPQPAPEPRVVIVRPPAPAPQPKVVVVQPPPQAPEPRVVVVEPPPQSRPHPGVPTHARERTVQIPEQRQGKEPWVNVTISTRERQVIREYYVAQSDEGNGKHGKKEHKGKSLPPGLAKKAARGEPLPPGWEKKVTRGQTMPAEVYRQCQPLPVEVTTRLPAPPPGTILVTIEGKVARLAQATLEILDVFDVL